MALALADKQAIVAEVNEAATTAVSAVLADYRGMTVAQMTDLRAKAREAGVSVRVVRNTLAKRAVAGTEFACLEEALVGPTLLAFSLEDPGAAARLFKDFVKNVNALEVKALVVGGQLLGPDKLEAVTKLPTREEALAMLAGLLNAPLSRLVTGLDQVPTQFVRTVNDIPGKFVRTVAAVRDKRQEGG